MNLGARVDKLEARALAGGGDGGEWLDLGDGPPIRVPVGTAERVRQIYGGEPEGRSDEPKE